MSYFCCVFSILIVIYNSISLFIKGRFVTVEVEAPEIIETPEINEYPEYTGNFVIHAGGGV